MQPNPNHDHSSARYPEATPRQKKLYFTRHPFLAATLEQFRYPNDGRKWRERARGRREACRIWAQLGEGATAREMSRFGHIPLRTMKRYIGWTVNHPDSLPLVENVDYAPDRIRRARGQFAGDRMVRYFHPKRLLAKPDRECGTPVNRECGTHKSSKSDSKASQATSYTDSAARVCEPPKRQEPKPNPQTNPDLLVEFAKKTGLDILSADSILGYLNERCNKRRKYRNAIGPQVRHSLAYVLASYENLDCADSRFERYSFSDQYGFPLPRDPNPLPEVPRPQPQQAADSFEWFDLTGRYEAPEPPPRPEPPPLTEQERQAILTDLRALHAAFKRPRPIDLRI